MCVCLTFNGIYMIEKTLFKKTLGLVSVRTWGFDHHHVLIQLLQFWAPFGRDPTIAGWRCQIIVIRTLPLKLRRPYFQQESFPKKFGHIFKPWFCWLNPNFG